MQKAVGSSLAPLDVSVATASEGRARRIQNDTGFQPVQLQLPGSQLSLIRESPANGCQQVFHVEGFRQYLFRTGFAGSGKISVRLDGVGFV